MAKSRDVVISTERVNCYGSRVITLGIDFEQYKRNPILLYMHTRGLPIGRVDNVRVEENKLLGTLVFDTLDPESKKIADKWDNNFLRMVSPYLEVLETSTEVELVVEGQTRSTVTKSRLMEISVVDIGGNNDALPLQLGYEGNVLKLAANIDSNALPILQLKSDPNEGINSINNLKTKQMKQILLALGLNEAATSDQAVSAIEALKLQAQTGENVKLQAITGLVDAAIADKRITADKKEHFVKLGKALGLEDLTSTLSLLHPATKPTDVIDNSKDGEKVALKWADLTPEKAAKLKKEEPEKYIVLFRDEFGCSPLSEA